MTTDTVVRLHAGTLLGAFTDGGTSNPPAGNEDAPPCSFTELPLPLLLGAGGGGGAAGGGDEAAVTSSEKSPSDVVVVVVVGEGGGKVSEGD